MNKHTLSTQKLKKKISLSQMKKLSLKNSGSARISDKTINASVAFGFVPLGVSIEVLNWPKL